MLIAIGGLSGVYTDLLWFDETGFRDVYTTRLGTMALLGFVFGTVFAVLLVVNLWVAQRFTHPARVFSMQDQLIERYRMLLRPYVRRIIVAGSIVLGIFAGFGATAQWRNWLLFRNATSFGEVDPIFKKDLGFFVFKLPFHRFVFAWGFGSLIVITLIVAGVHYFMGGIRTEGAAPRVAPHVKAHLSVLMGLLVALKAWGYRLDQFDLLYSPRGGQVIGASYTDVNAQNPALKLLVVIAIVCALLFLVNLFFKGWVLPATGIGLLLLTSIIAGGIYPATVQRLRVNPVERQREEPFIKRNIDATRAAFQLDEKHIEVRSLPATATIDKKSLDENKATVDNIRLWSPEILKDAYEQLQRITGYYEFADVDVDRYTIAGKKRQVMLSAREIDPTQLRAEAQTWTNKHLFYTHGYGVVASRVDTATLDGQPEFIIRDIPAKGVEGAPKIDQPSIYFGEQEAEQFVVANSSVPELDFPTEGGTGSKETKYAGKGGIPMSGFLRKLAFAWRFRDVNLLISDAVRPESRLLFRREVRERVRHVAPFLQPDSDPYIVIAGGRLVWVVDAYTATAQYPYSQRIDLGTVTDNNLRGTVNYIRNSVKATVDAYDGTVTLYVWDQQDPIIRAWGKVFPSLLRNKSEMPREIVEHVRYPEDLFKVQSERYALYHITNPIEFYSKSDVWRIPNDPSDPSAKLPPYYVLMRLPGETAAEFVLGRPFAPFSNEEGNKRQNMTAWLAARSDGANYGKLVSFVYRKDTNVDGPELVDSRIENDATVRQVKTQLDPTGARILKGNLLVIPIGDAVLYMQPLYLKSASNLPEFKRVVVATRDKVRIANTLTEALEGLFGDLPPTIGEPPKEEDVASLIAKALSHYNLSQAALKTGDFARYGREQGEMRKALESAQRRLGGPVSSPSPSPSPSGRSPSPTPSG